MCYVSAILALVFKVCWHGSEGGTFIYGVYYMPSYMLGSSGQFYHVNITSPSDRWESEKLRP